MTEQEYLDALNELPIEASDKAGVVKLAARVLFNLERVANALEELKPSKDLLHFPTVNMGIISQEKAAELKRAMSQKGDALEPRNEDGSRPHP